MTQDFGTSWKPQPRAAAAQGGRGGRGAGRGRPGALPAARRGTRDEVRDEKLSRHPRCRSTRRAALRRAPQRAGSRRAPGTGTAGLTARPLRRAARRTRRSFPGQPPKAAALPPSGHEEPQRRRTTLGRAPAAAPGVPRLLSATGRVADGLRGGVPRGRVGLVASAPPHTPAAHPPGAEARPSGAAQRPAVGPRQRDPGGRQRALGTAARHALRAPSGRGSPRGSLRSPRAPPLPRHFPQDGARGAALGTARSSHDPRPHPGRVSEGPRGRSRCAHRAGRCTLGAALKSRSLSPGVLFFPLPPGIRHSPSQLINRSRAGPGVSLSRHPPAPVYLSSASLLPRMRPPGSAAPMALPLSSPLPASIVSPAGPRGLLSPRSDPRPTQPPLPAAPGPAQLRPPELRRIPFPPPGRGTAAIPPPSPGAAKLAAGEGPPAEPRRGAPLPPPLPGAAPRPAPPASPAAPRRGCRAGHAEPRWRSSAEPSRAAPRGPSAAHRPARAHCRPGPPLHAPRPRSVAGRGEGRAGRGLRLFSPSSSPTPSLLRAARQRSPVPCRAAKSPPSFPPSFFLVSLQLFFFPGMCRAAQRRAWGAVDGCGRELPFRLPARARFAARSAPQKRIYVYISSQGLVVLRQEPTTARGAQPRESSLR